MNELKRIVEDIQSVFEGSSYPEAFMAAYDQMECLASHSGRETFLVQRKSDGGAAVASCYDRSVFPLRPDIDLLKELNHPGLPHYYEEYQNDQVLCIVREYIEGEPLSTYAKDRQLSKDEIVSIAVQLCDILDILHTHDPAIVHRDIKPENVIIRPDGSPVLIDFDIARTVRQDSGTDTVLFGTRGYAPPEQYGFGQTDIRADIYAFGVLLRWLVTGSVKENRNISMDENLQAVIDRCTSFSPEDRYADVRKIREALTEEKVRKPGRKVRPWQAAAALLASLLLLCAGFAAGRFTDWLDPSGQTLFQEPLIEQAVRLQLDRESGSLTEEDLSQVLRLYIYGTEAFADPEPFFSCSIDRSTEGPIRTLDDLALLPNLEELHLVHQGYVDAAGIAGMAWLQTVELKHMRLSGVAPLADAPRLKHAILFCTGISDVTALENCPWLETLDIGLNDIHTLAQIGYHPNVRSLGLMWLKMDNLDDIAERLPKVQAVTLQHGQFDDLSGIKQLPDLEAVYVLEDQAQTVRELFAGTDTEINITEN